MKLQGVTVLGATGSIGKSTLDVIARHPDRYRVVALTAHRQIEALAAQCIQFSPDYAVVADEQGAEQLQKLLLHSAPETTVLYGVAGLEQVAAAPEVDQVMAEIGRASCRERV